MFFSRCRWVGVDPIRVSRLTLSATVTARWCMRVFPTSISRWFSAMVSGKPSQSLLGRWKLPYAIDMTRNTIARFTDTVVRSVEVHFVSCMRVVISSYPGWIHVMSKGGYQKTGVPGQVWMQSVQDIRKPGVATWIRRLPNSVWWIWPGHRDPILSFDESGHSVCIVQFCMEQSSHS